MDELIYKNYDETLNIPHRENYYWNAKYFQSFILSHIPLKKDIKIIDLGCGCGKYVHLLGSKGYKNVSGVDISEGQIHYAKNNFNLCNVYVGNVLEFIKNENNSVDVIMLIDIIEHLESSYIIKLLMKVYEALTAEGILIIQTPNGLSLINPNIHGDFTHKRAFTTKSIEQILNIAGFKKYNHYPVPPFIHGLKSLIRRIFWTIIINPFLNIFSLIQNGERASGIFTPNIITIARKQR